MRLVTFDHGGQQRLGAFVAADSAIVDLQKAHLLRAGSESPALSSMLALIEGGDAALDLARALLATAPDDAVVQAGAITLLAPLPVPTQIRDFSGFELHMQQSGAVVFRMQARRSADPDAALAALAAEGPRPLPKVWYDQPIYYKGNRFAVAGTGADIVWPGFSRVADYELELGAVIGRTGRDIAAADARSHIFGYTIYNDFSARDMQGIELSGPFGPAKSKDFDGSTILGPCIVTADEIPDVYALAMSGSVNGELWSSGHMRSIHWTFEDMIAHVSMSETIHPGEIIGSGTVGNGCGLELERFLRDGDIVELTVEGIGTVRNRVVAPHIPALAVAAE